ncbi:hypothetical protein ScPMuIL_009185 [Solemya velum]
MDRIIDKSVAEADDFSELDINSRQKNTPPETGSRDVLIGGNCCEKGDNTESAPGFSKDQKAESDDNTNTKYGSIEKGDAEMEAVEDKETPEEEDKLHNIDVSDINSEKDLKERSLDGVQENQTQNKDDVDTFAFISEQLNFLNNESGVLTTHIHKSDGQMQEEKGKQGVKRRLDTSSIFGSKKEKRVKLDNTDGKVHADSSDEWIDVDSSDDSSSEDGWKIIVDSESELDKKLEEGAKKNKLSATNVKNILHHVITNEHVIAMVKNTLNEELNKQEQSLNETFEPKMTRSKVKQVLEKEGNVPHPWPLSPLKKSKTPPPNFLDLTFSEEDDDEEYEPLKDKEERNDSDEDAESCISSQLSDVMSPYSSEPSTPQSIQISDLDKTPGDGALIIASPVMGPPTKLMTPKRTLLGKKYLKAMSSEESTLSSGESDDQIIALRTRSRLPLTETSLIEIESNFVSPDITPDMYDTHCDDGDWQAFLKSLVTEKETVDVADDETNDPEYNYLEEADNEEMDEEDFRHDRAVRITKKELNGLMDELFEAYGDIDGLNEADKEFIKAQAQDSAISSNEVLDSQPCSLNSGQSVNVLGQDSWHVQLLTQTFILSQSSTDYNLAADIAKHMLNELYRFSNVLSPVPDSTAYRAYNLEEAVNIVNEDRDWVSKSPDISPKWRPLTVQRLRKHGFENVPLKSSCIYPPQLLPLTTTQKDVIYNSRVFMYPELLPKGGFLRSSELNKEKRRITFTKAEDGLIALGLEQFKPFPKYLKWIRKLMMPCKTQDQLRIRIKNLTASKSQDNIVKYYKKNKKLPECSRQYAIFNENDILAPKEQPNDSRPVWIADYEESMRALEDEAAECSIPLVASLDRRRASSITLPVIGDPPTPLSSNMVIDGELYYRINNKTLKKVNVIFHTPLQSDVPAEQPVEPANFQDDETDEKENVEVHQSEPRKNKSPSRPRISIKLKIPKKKKGKGRFYSLTEMSDSPEKISELGTDKDRETRSDLIIDRPGMEETVEHSESPMIPERNSSTEGEQTPAQHLELSAEELGIEVLKQDANTIVFQLKACDNEHGVTNFHSSENVSNLLNQQIGNTVFVPSLEKGTSAETTIHKDSASGLPLPNLCVVPSCQEAILDHGMPNRNSKIQLDILSEDANTSPQKRIQNEFLGENSNFGFFVQENSNSDILEKAFKSAMMGQGDISIDNSSLLRMLASPVKTSSPSKSSGSYNIHYTTETSSPNKFSCMASQSHNCEQNSDQINFSVSESVDHENVKPVEASQFSLNLSDVIENEKSLSSHHNNSGSGNPVSGIKCEKEANSSSSSQAESTDTSQKGSSISKDKVSNDTDSETEDVWTREADKALLEACKSAGSGEKTFKLISKALGNKTQIQVERRFLRLMELFAEIETPSEDEDSFENSK